MSPTTSARLIILLVFVACCGETPDPYWDSDNDQATADTTDTTNTDPESDLDTGVEPGSDSNTSGEANPDTSSNFETDTTTGVDSDTVSDVETDTKTGVDPDTDTGTATGVSIDLFWVSITGGKFNMGSPEGDTEELPIHRVNVPDFEMMKTEVTVTQYAACVTAGSCTKPGHGGTYDNWGTEGRENHPVNRVDWNQAVAFCEWAGGRLPSEAEWEYAASNGSAEDVYPWGGTKATCNYAVMTNGEHGCGTGLTMAVCSKSTGNTSHELCDMAGNVWEWVQDWYHPSYENAPDDGSAWINPVGSARVRRGGSFVNVANVLRAFHRGYDTPTDRGVSQGFRCVR